MTTQRWVVPMALAALILILGAKIPLPGMDMSVLSIQLSASDGALARLSIFALGLAPIYTAFSLVEIGRLFIREQRTAAIRPGLREGTIVGVIALAVTTLQGYGIAVALRTGGLADPDVIHFELLTVGTFMGSTALLLFLCLRLTWPGFRNGFWALMTVPVLVTLPHELAGAYELTRTGGIPGTAWLLLAVYLLVSVGLVTWTARLWRTVCAPDDHETYRTEPREILIWPALLAGTVATYAVTLMAVIVPDALDSVDVPWLQAIVTLMTVLILPVFVWAYARKSAGLVAPGAPLLAVAAVIAGVQILLVLLGNLVSSWGDLPLTIGLVHILAVTLAALGLQGGRTSGVSQTEKITR